MKFIISSILILFLAPCNSHKTLSQTKTETDNSKVMINCRKTACFGKCPVFTLSISGATKMMTYEGQRNVEKMGTYTKSISNDSITNLVAAFDKTNFMTLNEKYMSNISDFPSTIIGFTKTGPIKTVEERAAKPNPIADIEKLLMDIANSDGWKKLDSADIPK